MACYRCTTRETQPSPLRQAPPRLSAGLTAVLRDAISASLTRIEFHDEGLPAPVKREPPYGPPSVDPEDAANNVRSAVIAGNQSYASRLAEQSDNDHLARTQARRSSSATAQHRERPHWVRDRGFRHALSSDDRKLTEDGNADDAAALREHRRSSLLTADRPHREAVAEPHRASCRRTVDFDVGYPQAVRRCRQDISRRGPTVEQRQWRFNSRLLHFRARPLLPTASDHDEADSDDRRH